MSYHDGPHFVTIRGQNVILWRQTCSGWPTERYRVREINSRNSDWVAKKVEDHRSNEDLKTPRKVWPKPNLHSQKSVSFVNTFSKYCVNFLPTLTWSSWSIMNFKFGFFFYFIFDFQTFQSQFWRISNLVFIDTKFNFHQKFKIWFPNFSKNIQK